MSNFNASQERVDLLRYCTMPLQLDFDLLDDGTSPLPSAPELLGPNLWVPAQLVRIAKTPTELLGLLGLNVDSAQLSKTLAKLLEADWPCLSIRVERPEGIVLPTIKPGRAAIDGDAVAAVVEFVVPGLGGWHWGLFVGELRQGFQNEPQRQQMGQARAAAAAVCQQRSSRLASWDLWHVVPARV